MSTPLYMMKIMGHESIRPRNLHDILNNFFERVLTSYRNNSVLVEHWDTKFEDIPCIKKRNGDDHSELKLSQTPREFFKTIDDVIDQSTRRGKIIQLVKEYERIAKKYYDEEGHKKLSNIQQELNQKLLPIYKRLLMKGYNHIDLAR